MVYLGLHPGDTDLQGRGLQLHHLSQECGRRGGAQLPVSASQPRHDEGEDRGVRARPGLHGHHGQALLAGQQSQIQSRDPDQVLRHLFDNKSNNIFSIRLIIKLSTLHSLHLLPHVL